MLQRNGIMDSPTTSRNPQANAVCERLHQTVANILRTTTHGEVADEQKALQELNNELAIAVHETRCSVSRSLAVSPGSLVF